MIEAVNAVVSNAPLLRATTENVAVARSFAANPDRVQEAAPQAPYVSPHIYLDVNFDKAVIQIRDSDTGDVLSQFPSEEALRVRQHQSRQAAPVKISRSDNPEPAPQAEAQAAAAALEKSAQAAAPQVESTVVTSA